MLMSEVFQMWWPSPGGRRYHSQLVAILSSTHQQHLLVTQPKGPSHFFHSTSAGAQSVMYTATEESLMVHTLSTPDDRLQAGPFSHWGAPAVKYLRPLNV